MSVAPHDTALPARAAAVWARYGNGTQTPISQCEAGSAARSASSSAVFSARLPCIFQLPSTRRARSSTEVMAQHNMGRPGQNPGQTQDCILFTSKYAVPTTPLLHRQDDLADVFAGFHHGVRGSRLFQGKGGVHDGLDGALLQQGPYTLAQGTGDGALEGDRKSTRLNSSH